MTAKLTTRSKESGQVLVIIVLAIVGIFGFAALALDGGMLLFERRRAQNAADAGVMAAALAKIQGNNLFTTALQRAGSNGFGTILGDCSPAGADCLFGAGERWSVQVSNPPRNGDLAGNWNYVQLVITSEVRTSFAHLVFSGPLQTTVEAVSRVWPNEPFALGNALYAATEHDCKGIWFTGTGDTTITGGNVYSNSDADAKNCNSGVQDGAGIVSVEPPNKILVVGTFDEGGSGSVSPTPEQYAPLDPLRNVPQPICDGLDEKGAWHINAGEEVTLLPGNYESITFSTPDSKVTLTPGIYCVYGDKGFSGNGGEVSVGQPLNGVTGVMIYLQNGPFDLGGNTIVNLNAEPSPDTLLDEGRNDWKGMLIYVDPDNNSDVKITGTSNSNYSGTIFASASDCTIQGTGESIGLISSQVICYTVKVAGTAEVNIEYNASDLYEVPPAIDLVD
jgi:hypothetical protein